MPLITKSCSTLKFLISYLKIKFGGKTWLNLVYLNGCKFLDKKTLNQCDDKVVNLHSKQQLPNDIKKTWLKPHYYQKNKDDLF